MWDNIQHVRRIHGHDGATRLEFVPYGVLVQMVNASLDVGFEVEGGQQVHAALAEHLQREAELNRVARGEPERP